MACHEFHDKEWLDPRDCFSGLDRGPHKQKWPKFIKEKIYSELLMPALIQFKLLPCHQKMKCLHKNGNSYFFFYMQLKLFTGYSYREGNAQINYPFLFSQLGIAHVNGMYLYKQHTFTFRKWYFRTSFCKRILYFLWFGVKPKWNLDFFYFTNELYNKQN